MSVTYTTNRGTYGLVDCGEGFWAIALTLPSGKYVGDVGRAESPTDEGGTWMATRTFHGSMSKPGILVYQGHALDVLVEFTKEYEEQIPDLSEDPNSRHWEL